jgi:hypothetical protein
LDRHSHQRALDLVSSAQQEGREGKEAEKRQDRRRIVFVCISIVERGERRERAREKRGERTEEQPAAGQGTEAKAIQKLEDDRQEEASQATDKQGGGGGSEAAVYIQCHLACHTPPGPAFKDGLQSSKSLSTEPRSETRDRSSHRAAVTSGHLRELHTSTLLYFQLPIASVGRTWWSKATSRR